MILLSDASVLIDLGYVEGLELLVQIAPTEVLDVVLLECEDQRQPNLIRAIHEARITVVETQPDWVSAARTYRSADLSRQDTLNLHYAKTYDRVLLATDKPLRERCVREGVEVRGTLWLVAEALEKSLVAPEQLCRWLRLWPTLGSRLPKEEVKRLKNELECT